MGGVTCVSCGECVAACPTGALVDKPITVPLRPRAELDAGRQRLPVLRRRLRAHLPRRSGAERDRLRRGPRAARAASGRLCVKGRYGWDYALHAQRLAAAADPARRALPEGAALARRARRVTTGGASRAASSTTRRCCRPSARPRWDEALDLVARRASERSGTRTAAGALAGFGIGQVLERGGLPLPEARAGRLRHQQRRPLHAALPRVERRGAARGDRLAGRSPPPTATSPTPTSALIAGSNTTANHPGGRHLLQAGEASAARR